MTTQRDLSIFAQSIDAFAPKYPAGRRRHDWRRPIRACPVIFRGMCAALTRLCPPVAVLALLWALALPLGMATAEAAESRPGKRKPQPVKIIDSWRGTLADGSLKKLAPADGFILEEEKWAKLWKAWRGQEATPKIDFEKQMILVFTAEGPNNVGCEPTLDAQGNVQALAMSTLIGGPGFGYLMLCIPREGVRSVNGTPLPGEAPPRKPGPKRPPRMPGVVPGSPGSADSPGSPPSGEPGVSGGSSEGMSSEPGAGGTVESPPSSGTVSSQPDAGVAASSSPPVIELDPPRPNRAAWEGATWKKPLVLMSAKDATKYFDGDELAKMTKLVDFNKQVAVVFVWRGSGQDRIDAAVAESYPEQVFFTRKPGRTRDLREHVRAFALRSNVTWSVRDN